MCGVDVSLLLVFLVYLHKKYLAPGGVGGMQPNSWLLLSPVLSPLWCRRNAALELVVVESRVESPVVWVECSLIVGCC